MSITHKLTAVALLAGASLLALPAAHAKGPLSDYDAYEDLSGTHPGAKYTAPSGMRGREGAAGESGPAGKMTKYTVDINQAYEDLSGTHPTMQISQSGVQGRSGAEGQAGTAGRTSASSLFNLQGDVANGCSKFLRCSAE